MPTTGLADRPAPSQGASPRLTLNGFNRDFAAAAERIVADRMSLWPAKVERGDMDRATFERRIFVMRAIAEIWRCAGLSDCRPQRAMLAVGRQEILDELVATIAAAEDMAMRRPGDPAARLRLEQLHAMRWWHAFYPASAYAHNMICGLVQDALKRQMGE